MPERPRLQSESSKTTEVRALTFRDIRSILTIEKRAFTAPWSWAMFISELSKRDTIALGAIKNRQLVGYLICSRFAGIWHLMNIAVDPDSRRSGIGRLLVKRLLELIESPNLRLTLEVRASNTPALALYHDFGFRVAGRRPRYYADNGEDAVIMWWRAYASPTYDNVRSNNPGD